MAKLKHFQGYGCVDTKLISRTKNQIVIQVTGDHEYGLKVNRGDKYDVSRWLGKRYHFEEEDIDHFEMYLYCGHWGKGLGERDHIPDSCDYYISLKAKRGNK